MKVLIIGAGGGIGSRLTRQLVESDDEVSGLHRRPEQRDEIGANGATAVIGDLVADSIERLAELTAGHDAVVFTAGAHGAGPEHTTAIDGDGVRKAAAAAEQAGARKFVLVSAFPESERQGTLGEGFEHYLRVKKQAEIDLSRTNLDWIIVRPGKLLDTAGNGSIDAGPIGLDQPIPRDDVAAFIVAALHHDGVARTVVEISGGDTAIADTVDFVASAVGPRR